MGNEISRFASGAPWEPIFGYSRAVHAGGWLAVSGTTSFDERGLIVGQGQMYVQARQAIANIASVLERAGLSLANVVRTRMFVTDMSRFADVARAHGEVFRANPPAATIVEVTRLIHPDMLIEIEADAYAGGLSTEAAPAGRTRPVVRRKAATSGKRARARRVRRRFSLTKLV